MVNDNVIAHKMNFLTVLYIYLQKYCFLYITKLLSFLYINLFKLTINFILLFPDSIFIFLSSDIYIEHLDDSDDSDSDFSNSSSDSDDSDSESGIIYVFDNGSDSDDYTSDEYSDSDDSNNSDEVENPEQVIHQLLDNILEKICNSNKKDACTNTINNDILSKPLPKVKNTFPINSQYCINISNKMETNKKYFKNEKNLFNNDYLFTLLNNIKTTNSYHILYSEVLYLKNNDNIITYNKTIITKKFTIIFKFHNTMTIKLLNHYFNNPKYFIIIYYSFYTNETIYRVIDLQNNKDITNNKYIQFGYIKL